MASARKSVARAIAAVAIVVLGSSAAASAVTASLPDNAVIASVGGTTVVNLTVGAFTNLEAAAFNITFDPNIVVIPAPAANSVQLGPAASGCGNLTPNINVAGRLTVTFACITPVNGSGTLLTITFQGVANGVSPLTFTTSDDVPNGCQFNEGTPSCEPDNGQITVGPQQPTSTVTNTPASTNTATSTPVPATATATGTVTSTVTATHTNTIGPSPTPSHTGTVTNTPSPTSTSAPTNTPTQTVTASATGTVTQTATASATFTATPVPSPRITSGAVGGSTRVFGIGAPNIAAPGIEIVAEDGGVVLGTGGTNANGAFTDGPAGIGLNRALIPGERIFPRDVVNGLTGPVVIVGPQPPQEIPALDEYGMAVLGSLLALAMFWRLGAAVRRRR
jgi:hypothetical protein